MIESMTRRELARLYETYLKPVELKLARKNANVEKIKNDFMHEELYKDKLIHLLCLKIIANECKHVPFDQMLEYNIIFVDKQVGDFKIIDRFGAIIDRYKIDYVNNHLIYEGKDLGSICLIP